MQPSPARLHYHNQDKSIADNIVCNNKPRRRFLSANRVKVKGISACSQVGKGVVRGSGEEVRAGKTITLAHVLQFAC